MLPFKAFWGLRIERPGLGLEEEGKPQLELSTSRLNLFELEKPLYRRENPSGSLSVGI